jgi:hypothetical protein
MRSVAPTTDPVTATGVTQTPLSNANANVIGMAARTRMLLSGLGHGGDAK